MERFVDVAEKPIPPVNTWNDLSTNELVETKVMLQEKSWQMKGHQTIAKVLNDRLKLLDQMISARLNQ